ncbi:uncharacterized protein LOC130498331 isoform X1 [Raphanus sativus]|uniref:Uncharacterized protein LOC130498331 isoform X1 n=1 Tax=Raphanus sativus TaxID=3726 RepID=A0A9W3C7X9_RAPSA|nr:uncharacterized protein LOC130498331 isoform X1 [Raphanus sativus]XP_056847586.1 uncharacterized protein LOC130498331 isoform X1 [Raphanus sativus]
MRSYKKETLKWKVHLSFGGSQWCRSTPTSPHRSTSSMSFPDTTADCNAVRILTHAEFTASHPYPPTHTYEDFDRRDEPLIDRHKDEKRIDRPFSPPIDRHAPLTYRVQLPSIDNNRINALRPTPKPQANPTEITGNPSDTTPTSEGTEGRRLRSRKEKIPKNLKREANEKEIDGFTKRVIRIPPEKLFEEVYFTSRLWMFFRKTRETKTDIKRRFDNVREDMRKMITLQKKSDPGKFAIPCIVQGIEFPHALCDTGSSINILPKVMADHLGLQVEPSPEIFTFVDYTQKNSGGFIRDLEVHIGNAIVPVDFNVLDIKLNWNSSFLLGRAFMATVGAICDMNTNRMCLTMIDPEIHYDPVKLGKPPAKSVVKEDDTGIIAVCHCEVEYETEYSGSIDSTLTSSIDTCKTEEIDKKYGSLIDRDPPDDELDLPDHCYPNFAIPPSRKKDDYSVRSWADSGFHESFVVDIATSSHSGDHSEEHDADYWKERAWENYLENDRFAIRFPQLINIKRPQSIDYLLHPAKRHRPSIDIASITSIDINPDDLKDKIRISPIRTTHGYKGLTTQATKIQNFSPSTQQLPTFRNLSMEDCNNMYNRSNRAARRAPSIATTTAPSIDAFNRAQPRSHEPYDIRNVSLTPDEFGIFREQMAMQEQWMEEFCT